MNRQPERGRPRPRVPVAQFRADEGVRAPADRWFMALLRDSEIVEASPEPGFRN